MRHLKTIAILGILPLVFLSAQRHAASSPVRVAHSPGHLDETVLTPVADTWGWQSVLPNQRPPEVHGRDTILVTGKDDTRGNQIAFLQFDLSSVDLREVRAARLELLVKSTLTPGLGTTRVRVVQSAWSEATLADELLPAEGPEVAASAFAGMGWMSWDVTEAVNQWRSGSLNAGLALFTVDDGIFKRIYASRESDRPPRLVLSSQAIPTRTPAPTARPTPVLPNLTGFAWTNCFGTHIHLEVENRGNADAGAFSVRSVDGEPSWRVDGLKAGESKTLEPKTGLHHELLIDADNEVIESNERDNRIGIAIPSCGPQTFMPFLGRQ